MGQEIDSKTTLPFTQTEYDALPDVGLGCGIPGKFYRTSNGVTQWIARTPGRWASDRDDGYWLDFAVRIVDSKPTLDQ